MLEASIELLLNVEDVIIRRSAEHERKQLLPTG